MKLKKIVAAVACVAMASVFATSAFAADAAALRQEAQAYLASQGLSYDVNSISDAQIEALAASTDKASLKAEADALIAELKADPSAANAAAVAAKANGALAAAGITVDAVNVKVSGSSLVVSANVNGAPASVVMPADASAGAQAVYNSLKDEHPEIGAAIANGTWGVDQKTASSAASLTTSTAGVIKATGDNTGVMLLVAILGVAGVLGLAVRKNNEMV